MSASDPAAIAAAIQERRGGRRLLLCCDFDGTLVEFQADPAAVWLPEERRGLLQRFVDHPRASVGIVSGRRLADIRERTGLAEPAWFAGLHGLEIEGGGEHFVHPQVAEARALVQGLSRVLAPRVAGRPGAFIENKDLSVAVHFRESPPAVQAEVASAFEQLTRPAIETGRLRVMHGSSVLELLPNIPWNKGDAVRWIDERVRRHGGPVLPVYLGDDVTDQDAFRELEGRGIRVAASNRVTGGDFEVDGPAGITALLAALADTFQ
jgi:trehalose 6-phosphate phosphatase